MSKVHDIRFKTHAANVIRISTRVLETLGLSYGSTDLLLSSQYKQYGLTDGAVIRTTVSQMFPAPRLQRVVDISNVEDCVLEKLLRDGMLQRRCQLTQAHV